MTEQTLGPENFARQDEGDDALFYGEPRLVTHIDDAACAALANAFRDLLPSGGHLLDLMSSCVSHLPLDVAFERVCGLGMNQVELDANPHLSERVVHDLTRDPRLPLDDGEFDACMITVSVQYLTRPVEVFRELARVLKPGAPAAVSFSNRCFPTKAVAIWRGTGHGDHARLVAHYFTQAEGFETPEFNDLSPNPGFSDPLYMVSARRAGVTGAPTG